MMTHTTELLTYSVPGVSWSHCRAAIRAAIDEVG